MILLFMLIIALEASLIWHIPFRLLDSFILFAYFAFKYFDHDEFTGNRAWPWLRSRGIGKSAIELLVGRKPIDADKRYLFIVRGECRTHLGLIYTFGFHGGYFDHLDLVYLLPRAPFYVPLLRDVLLWSGAIAYPSQDPLSSILQLLKRGKAVAYHDVDITDDLLEFCMQNHIHIVPTSVSRESERYAVVGDLCFMRKSSRKLLVKMDFPFDSAIYQSRDQLKNAIEGAAQTGPRLDTRVQVLQAKTHSATGGDGGL